MTETVPVLNAGCTDGQETRRDSGEAMVIIVRRSAFYPWSIIASGPKDYMMERFSC